MKKHGRSLFINVSAFILTAGLLFGNTSSEILAAAEDTSGEGISEQDEGSLDFWQYLFEAYGLSGEKTAGEKIAEAPISTVFIGEPFYDGTIENEDDALDAIYSIMDRLGGDENVELVFHDMFENDEETVFYFFEQAIGGLKVDKGYVKLIVNNDGTAIGLISTLVCGLEEDPDYVWEITQEEAETIVSDMYKEDGAKVIPESTEATVLWDEYAGSMTYVWVVYSTNPDAESERSYLAHYISGNGEYQYALPVIEPGDSEALSGSTAVFAFEGYEPGEWSGVVQDIDGPERTITVPVLIDKETGDAVLGDPERKILCADYTDFNDNDTLTPIVAEEGTFINNELITYEMFIRIWDFYDNIGWHGPDAEGTPSLLLLNLVDEDGQPIDNAAYVGMLEGFQVFEINDAFGDGSCSDIMGHEFTHCVTNKSLSQEIYENDYGAINEALSDIMGNLIEMYFGDSPGGEWLFSERHSNGTIRNMKDPHEFNQPEYVWDMYYVPNVSRPNDENDRGGVHTNSSILNNIAYKLDQAGMPLEDQIYYWLNADLSMTPTTDFPLLAQILPWCLDMTGYSEYKEVMEDAIEQADMTRVEVPEVPRNDLAIASLTLPFDPEEFGADVTMYLMRSEDEELSYVWKPKSSSTLAAVVPGGDYLAILSVCIMNQENAVSYYFLTDTGWVATDGGMEDILTDVAVRGLDSVITHFNAGEVTELTTDGL